jgi:hypothetical protein
MLTNSSVATQLAGKSRLGSSVCNQELSNFVSYNVQNILLHAVNVQHGTTGFILFFMEVVLWILTALPNPSTLAGLNQQTLGLMESMLPLNQQSKESN